MFVNNSTLSKQMVLFKGCRDGSSVSQIVLTTIIIIMSIISNGAICCLLVRFRSLRTVPNILVANLAFIDVINAITNMPLFIMWYLCQVRFLTGPAVSWIIVTWYVLFMYLTVTSLVVLMLDRYGAIVHGLKYHTWKTKNKAAFAVIVIWLIAMSYTLGMFSLGVSIDVGNMPVWIYRIYYFKNFGRSFLIPGQLIPFAFMVILGFLIWRKVRVSTRAIAPQSNVGKRVRSDVQTAKTLAITILAYFLMGCFPVLLHSIAKLHGSWIHFSAFFFTFLNSMANPVIYSLRTRRFRAALLLLLRDPCGDSQPTDKKSRSMNSSTVATNTKMTTFVSDVENRVF
ncbi:neuromedin-U receptor 2-like [Exaiptasia diaphana]|uniref:G-protein coupled receptors family 1 profile domain-containing protein n=1 Tax=Exaiptasia diaphana TaxID=2652724 RepID=A0A913XZR1_EXADI|nr:neuromedin-U receptor 2-like [Exaiptasia diaphana]